VQYRRFGNTDLSVSEVGFGCARIGGIFQGLERADYRTTLWKALDAGVNFFDTSDMYCNGESEAILGDAFAGVRDRVILASKAGYCVPRQRHLAMKIKPLLRPLIRLARIQRHRLPANVTGTLTQDFSPDYLVRSVEASLKRLRTDYLDLFQLHSPPASVLEAGDFLAPLEKLKADGKIRYFGVSCETAADAAICLRYPSIDALQLEISLLAPDALAEVLPRCAARGVGVIARECLGGGLLAKPLAGLGLEYIVQDVQRRAALEAQLVALHEAAETRQCSLRQLALQFVLDQDAVSVALLGMRTADHVSSNLELLTRRLTRAELAGVSHTSPSL
jgi:aryl-alcohol dehydrogenase-like predicted oxidoreductase